MGGEQAAGVLATVTRDIMTKKKKEVRNIRSSIFSEGTSFSGPNKRKLTSRNLSWKNTKKKVIPILLALDYGTTVLLIQLIQERCLVFL